MDNEVKLITCGPPDSVGAVIAELCDKTNIIAIYICADSVYDLPNYGSNIVHRLSRHLITNEITFQAIHAYESLSQQLFLSGPKGLASVLGEKADDLKRWLTTNNKVKACHILIIPLNTTDGNLIDFQQRFIEMCKRVCPDKEIIVCTIYDYIAAEEANFNTSNGSSFLFQRKQRELVCRLIKKVAPIRIYLAGNEANIINYWSRLLIPKELDNSHINVRKYSERCTFMENEPVIDEIRRNLSGFLGCVWQMRQTNPMRLDDVEKDLNFLLALEGIYDTLDIREREANVNLSQRSINYREKSSDHSSELHMIGQAVCGPTDSDGNFSENMDNNMQRDFEQPLPD